ncbi:mycofactocin biosynthesis chaperone MftB [Intrasporangium sp.]|uniref:mycofactocin biosynthesis chaperone MftB n=1 Tax=Intrasporangium sp. TaxID=1925024 RepID=UPI003221FB02
MTATDPVTAFDADAAWRVHPRVAVRPEPFGALLYHFDTRRLTFLKDPRLLTVVRALDGAGDARGACAAAGIAAPEQPRYLAALARLAEAAMIVPGRTP